MRKEEVLRSQFDNFRYFKKGFTITSKVRQSFYLPFKETGKKTLKRREIIDALVKKYPELLDADGEIRSGVFDGIIHKMDLIPVPYVEKKEKGHKSYFVYTGKKK